MRIIGGDAKGIILLSPKGENTRPTLGRVRESIFNVLANVGLVDTDVLDVFAGTGAMGLEALSRGARSAVLIDKATGSVIRENAKKCGMENRVRILSADVKGALASLKGRQFDYIFMDPPYRKGYINEILAMIFENNLCREEAVIAVEHSVSEPPDLSLFPGKCTLWKEKKLGAIIVSYLLCSMTEVEHS